MRRLAADVADAPETREAKAWLERRSQELYAQFRAGWHERYDPSSRERIHPEMDAALKGDKRALYQALREAGVMAFVDWPWVRLVVYMWRLAVSWPYCTRAERREARERLEGIGAALAGHGRGRIGNAETASARTFVRKYLPMLQKHLKIVPRVGALKPSGLNDRDLGRYWQLLKAGFNAQVLSKRERGVDAYSIMAAHLDHDQRYVRRLARS